MITPLYYKHKKIAVFGLGKDGTSAVQALSKAGAIIFTWDDNEASHAKIAQLPGVTVSPFAEWPWESLEVLVLSPGIPLTHPEPAPVVKQAHKTNTSIVCTLELLYQAEPESRYVGITGTNGKSTTTTLIGHILKESNVDFETGGNLGIPALDLRELGKNGVYVLEMSSYQLDLIDTLTCDVGILLNVTPDHLDRHGDMQGYIAAKMHMFDNQGKEHAAIIGVDNEHSRVIYEKLKTAGKIGKIIPISAEKQVAGGVSVLNGVCYADINGKEQAEIGAVKSLAGNHNAENMAAAIATALALGVTLEDAVRAVKTFAGLRHRLQYLGEVDGVVFVNDSKATNAEASEKALLAYDNIYWIAGGREKEGGIAMLEPLFPRIREAFLIGECQENFAKTLEGKVPYHLCGTLASAFTAAYEAARKAKGEKPVVMLAPACASWDQWPNFEARGDFFCEQVEQLKQKKERKQA